VKYNVRTTCPRNKQFALKLNFFSFIGMGPETKSRRHGGCLVGLAPQTKLQAPPSVNAKPPAETQTSPIEKLSGDGSAETSCKSVLYS